MTPTKDLPLIDRTDNPYWRPTLDNYMRWFVKGDIPSLKNVLRVGRGGQFYHKDDQVKNYKASFYLQTPARYRLMVKPTQVILTINQKDRRKDGHNQEATVFDCLQHTKVIKNDRDITSWACLSRVDKNNPGVLIEISYSSELRKLKGE